MLESLLSSNEFETEMRESLTSAAESVKSVFRKWEAKFAAIQDEMLRQRPTISSIWPGEFCANWKAPMLSDSPRCRQAACW